jgi:CHAT domain-containing protein
MTPQQLADQLLWIKDQARGRRLLQQHLPLLSATALARLVELVKREADRRWNTDPQASLLLADYLVIIGELSGERSYHALGLMARGDALRRLERPQEALSCFERAGQEFRASGDEVGWARTRIGRISVCLQLQRPQEALASVEEARDIFLRHGRLLRAGQIDVNAAIVHYELGHYNEALRLLDRALETYALHGEGAELHVARARANKAVTLAALGRFREAVALHEQARATFAAYPGQQLAVAREELNIAQIYAAQGHFSQALLLFNRCRALFLEQRLTFAAAEVACEICHCLLRLNRAREASELASEAVACFRSLPGGGPNLAMALMWQAQATMLTGDHRAAEAMLREARDLLEAHGLQAAAATVRLHQAELFLADGQLTAGLHEARQAAAIFARLQALPQLARATWLQARIIALGGELAAAEELCTQALALAQQQGLLDLQYRCHHLLARSAEQRGDLEEAARCCERAVRSVEEIQSRLVLDARSDFLEDKHDLYADAVRLALRRQKVEQALRYVEKSKSRVLGDYLRNTIDIRLRADDSEHAPLLEELARLREEQAWFSSLVYDAEQAIHLSDTAVRRLRAIDPARARLEMQERERRIERLLEQVPLALASAGDGQDADRWSSVKLPAVLACVEPRTLLLEYYLAGQDLYVFAIARGRLTWQQLPGAVPQLERLSALWRVNLDLAAQAAAAPDGAQRLPTLYENALGLLRRLYHLLLDPLSSLLDDCERLIVIPYGLLHYLPFHCLFDGARFLIEQLEVSYLPALSLLEICRQRAQQIAARGFSPGDALVLGLSDNGRLIGAVQEAQTIARLLGAPCYLNEAATALLLQQAGARAPIVHIAAHGLFRLDAPNFSFIRLADRQLSSIELFNLDLSACSLVSLSACETGRAVVAGLDEVIGLGRGFLYAGAASLLATLWKVDDASSAALMTMVYRDLLAGRPKVSALASAQRAFLARARAAGVAAAHPYFWAAFQLIGDPGPL